MAEWLREPGFMGTHATIGADLSQLMATLFTVLFILLSGFFSAVLAAIVIGLTSWIASWYVGPSGRVEILIVRRDS